MALTTQQQSELRQAIGGVFSTHDGSAAVTAEAIAAIDPKQLFCDNWDSIIKPALAFLAGYVPAWAKPVVNVLIAAGDVAKRMIC